MPVMVIRTYERDANGNNIPLKQQTLDHMSQ